MFGNFCTFEYEYDILWRKLVHRKAIYRYTNKGDFYANYTKTV